MELAVTCGLFCLGLLLIVRGGNYFVDAAAWIAEVSGVPKVIVGATVVSIATTLPEIVVSLLAALDGKPDMAVGNAMGSVTANLGLIFALCALLGPFAIRRRDYAVKGLLMVGAVGALYFFSRKGRLSMAGVVVLLMILAAFVVENIHLAQASQAGADREKPTRREAVRRGVDFMLGIVGIVAGAELLVHHGGMLALSLGVPEGVVAATLVAVGTALPELVTAAAAIIKRQGALSVGNILGANIIDTTLIIPLCGLASGQALPVSGRSLGLDMPLCLLIAAAAVLPMLIARRTSRRQGLCVLALYGAYIALLLVKAV